MGDFSGSSFWIRDLKYFKFSSLKWLVLRFARIWLSPCHLKLDICHSQRTACYTILNASWQPNFHLIIHILVLQYKDGGGRSHKCYLCSISWLHGASAYWSTTINFGLCRVFIPTDTGYWRYPEKGGEQERSGHKIGKVSIWLTQPSYKQLTHYKKVWKVLY